MWSNIYGTGREVGSCQQASFMSMLTSWSSVEGKIPRHLSGVANGGETLIHTEKNLTNS